MKFCFDFKLTVLLDHLQSLSDALLLNISSLVLTDDVSQRAGSRGVDSRPKFSPGLEVSQRHKN